MKSNLSVSFLFFFSCILLLFSACDSAQQAIQIPKDTYSISVKKPKLLDSNSQALASKPVVKANLEQNDSTLKITAVNNDFKPTTVSMAKINNLRLHRYAFDLDVLTIPFKIRPAQAEIPEQLNPNFSAAVYAGLRRDSYRVSNRTYRKKKEINVQGFGYGYGAFLGLGATTMNAYVTRNKIDYEYDGFVINGGFAGIVDVNKFNLGLAIGADYLVDKNKGVWIYQGKPWFGILFGLNLN